jgi:hypothetical protein
MVKKKSKKKVGKFLYWTPRIVSIAFLLFLAMFSLDIFDAGYDFWGTVLGLFMHNIPVFILTILLVIAWKHEIVGAITFYIAALIYIGFMVHRVLNSPAGGYMLLYSMIIAVPAFFIATLFLIGWNKKKKH